jgi:hypothetical protein
MDIKIISYMYQHKIHILICILFILLVWLHLQSSVEQNAVSNSRMVQVPLSKHITHFTVPTTDPFLNLGVELGIPHITDTTIRFVNSTTNSILPSIDYDMIVKQGNTTIYKASEQADQINSPVRSENGIISIQDRWLVGNYAVDVYIYGINGIPLSRVEHAYFEYTTSHLIH